MAINNTMNVTIIWLLGISLIGIPLLLMILLGKIITLAIEIAFIIKSIKKIKILWAILYLIPKTCYTIIVFFMVYYAIEYSSLLIKTLFLKKEYNLKNITKQYRKVLWLSIMTIAITSIIELIIIPNTWKIFL